MTNPKAREFLWEACKKNYLDYGIDMFWLDNIEPDLVAYDFDNFRYYLGTALEVNNIYPQMVAKAFCDGMKKEGREKDMLAPGPLWLGGKPEIRHASVVRGCAQYL